MGLLLNRSLMMGGGKRITVLWNQLVRNGNFDNADYWNANVPLTVENHMAVLDCSGKTDGTLIQFNVPSLKNHATIWICEASCDKSCTITYTNYYTAIYPTHNYVSEPQIIVNEYASPNDYPNAHCRIRANNFDGKDVIVTISKVKIIDLTLMYGVGAEPTLDEFIRQCALNGVDIYGALPYDEGTEREWKA